eukprot:488709_1
MSEQKSSSHDQDVTHGIEPDLDLLDFSKLEQADFDCPLCLRSLHDPLTITCGHTFCRDCLARALAIKKYCPLCREECHVEASSHATNALMSSLLEKCNRELVEARKEEVKIEKSQRKERLCVFLLDKVQFPGVNLYLQIYEPKYRVMIDRAMHTHRKFVAALPNSSDLLEDDPQPCFEGCVILIDRCHHLPDGRSLVESIGTQRVHLTNIRPEEHGYGLLSAEVSEIKDRDADEEIPDLQAYLDEPASEVIRRVYAYLASVRSRLEDLVERKLVTTMPEEYVQLPFWVMGVLIPGTCSPGSKDSFKPLQYRCLQSTSVHERFTLTCENLDLVTKREVKQTKYQSFMVMMVIIIAVAYVFLHDYTNVLS